MSKQIEKRCVILGGCGFLGSVVTRHLVGQGWDVRVFDKEGTDTTRLQEVASRIEFVRGDFMNIGDLRHAIDGVPVVIHFVGTTIPQTSMADIQFEIETNVMPTVRLLGLMEGNGNQRLLFASSGGTVYGISESRTPITEQHKTDPIAAYGISKLMIEKFISLFSFNYKLPAVVLRIANPFGPSQVITRPQGAVSTFVDKIVQGASIHVWGDGSTVRDYLFEEDLAAAVEAILVRPDLNGIYNVGTGIGTSLNELAEIVGQVFSKKSHVIHEPSRAFDVPYNVLDIGRLTTATGWQPRFSLRNGLEKMKESRLASAQKAIP